MSKSVLVIDTPNKCTDCTFCEHLDEGWLHCSLKDKTARAFDKPDWCPLTPLPEKRVHNAIENEFQRGANSGYNYCIDEILNGEK